MIYEWRSKGWTLQEGILSNRCDLFGPEQVYFECAEMACSESVQEPSLSVCQQDLNFDEDALNALSAFTAEFERSGHSLIWSLSAQGLVQHLLRELEPCDLRDARRRKRFP